MKKLLTIFVILSLLVCTLSACGDNVPDSTTPKTDPTPTGSSESQKLKIGLVTSTGGLGDKSFNDQSYAGLEKAVREIGAEMDYVEPHDFSDIEPLIEEFAKVGYYDIIVAIGYDSMQPVRNLAPYYPDQKFLLVDNPIDDVGNVASLTFNKSEEGFLTGIFCAFFANMNEIEVSGQKIQLDNSKKAVGAILGVENPDIIEALAGFRAGLKYIDPDVKVLYSSVGSWNDQNKAREQTMAHYGAGATMVWQDAGNSGLGIFKAAADSDLFTLGWNSAQHLMDPEHILCSVIKTLDNAIYEWVIDYVNTGEFKSGNKDNGCYNDSIYMMYSESFSVPEEIISVIEDARAKLASGDIVSPLTLQEVDEFSLRYEE